MSSKKLGTRKNKLLAIGGVLVALLVVGVAVGPWAYAKLVVGDQPDELALPASDATAKADPSAPQDALDGTWSVGGDSTAGYRVAEVLFGRDVTVVGRTSQVDGGAEVAAGVLDKTEVTVDLASVATDEARRDAQYRDRIMDTDTYPTATFTQTAPVDLPATSGRFTVTVPGQLSVRGVTRDVSVDLDVQAAADRIDVAGSIEVTFADYDIPEPGFAGISVDDHGTIEFLLQLDR
ncbi:YceI family protein [Nocardioides nitrophenolicus]|uniref:YceI family protein n=1 Tax=Nocardioides nitrophenolicus TaxID=60489 RepID=UPI001959756E|nr:YceI family protein [Nocardioides nitrophenolicus]MBM7518020.1 polyisoprenoid-binding protein YceI [Nocardioides nitrophenolicus]